MFRHTPLGRLRAYAVVSREYTTSSHVSVWDYEPPETGCDYRLVFARTARKAKVLAVRSWRRDKFSKSLDDAECPFTGMRVYRIDHRCFVRPH